MHNFTTITITTFCLALLFGQTQGNDVLAMGRNVEKPKILSIEECKKIAEKDFQTHLDILLKAPEVHPGDKERNLAEYNLLSGAKITDWTVYLGYDDLPYAVEFLFKKNGRGVWSSTIIMRGEGGPIYGSAICPEVLKQYPHAEVQLAVARLPKWIETLKTKGYPVTENTPYDLYFLKAHSCYFVVFKIEENGKKDEIVVDLYDGPIQDLGYFRTLEEIKKMTRELIEHPKQHIEKGELQDLNKSNPGKGSFPPAGHFEYIIDNVPNYLQEFLGHKCGPTSCTDVMMYWQNQGYLDGSSPGEYADDFAEVIGEEPSPTQIPHGFKEVARLHDETFLTAQNLLLPDTPLPQAYQFFMNFVYFLGERRPIVLCEIELPRGHANCCWGFEGKGEDMKTWKYWVWDTRSYSPRSISAWVQAENRWYKVYYALGWPVEPPEVYYTDPPSGEKGSSEDVDIYKNILIAFTKTMDRTPVESAIEVKNLDENRLVEIKGIEWLEEDKTILLRCYDPEVTDDTTGLQYNRNYQVTIKGTAKDTAGIIPWMGIRMERVKVHHWMIMSLHLRPESQCGEKIWTRLI
ncbi:MAG: Ig-like domain-containing protein [candidate division WOR-3 bacterium]|nr:Ig-like domain-containing protein [candidate division WOR-3 bacterium]